MGKLDNTLIIYIVDDNGTSAEGTLVGTFNQMTAYNGILDAPEALQLLHFNDWGSDKTYPHMSVAWSWAFDTPFKWTKQVETSSSGVPGRAWPSRGPATLRTWAVFAPSSTMSSILFRQSSSRRHPGTRGGQRDQAEADRRREHGLHLRPGERESPIQTRDAILRDVWPTRHLPRRLGRCHAAARSTVWLLGTTKMPDVNNYQWELYNIAEDYSEYNDLAASNTDKLKDL